MRAKGPQCDRAQQNPPVRNSSGAGSGGWPTPGAAGRDLGAERVGVLCAFCAPSPLLPLGVDGQVCAIRAVPPAPMSRCGAAVAHTGPFAASTGFSVHCSADVTRPAPVAQWRVHTRWPARCAPGTARYLPVLHRRHRRHFATAPATLERLQPPTHFNRHAHFTGLCVSGFTPLHGFALGCVGYGTICFRSFAASRGELERNA